MSNPIEFQDVSTGDDVGRVIELLLDRKPFAAIRSQKSRLEIVTAPVRIMLDYEDFLSAISRAGALVAKGVAKEVGAPAMAAAEAERNMNLSDGNQEVSSLFNRARQAYLQSVAAFCDGNYARGADLQEVGHIFLRAADALESGEPKLARDLTFEAEEWLSSF